MGFKIVALAAVATLALDAAFVSALVLESELFFVSSTPAGALLSSAGAATGPPASNCSPSLIFIS